VDTHDRSAKVPWYRITVDDGNRTAIRHVEFLGYHDVSGPAIAMGAKYDHLIEGWDFAYPSDKLALETHLIVGNYIPERTAMFIHDAYPSEHADDGTTTIGNATSLNTTAPTHPTLYTRDRVFFDDDFTRIGRFEWATNVTVDGQAAMMTFNIQGGGHLVLAHAGAYFVGFWLRAAFVYPAGQMIVHDPRPLHGSVARPAVRREPHAGDDPRGPVGGRLSGHRPRPVLAIEGEAQDLSASPFSFPLQTDDRISWRESIRCRPFRDPALHP